jgi:hypothetical protein
MGKLQDIDKLSSSCFYDVIDNIRVLSAPTYQIRV